MLLGVTRLFGLNRDVTGKLNVTNINSETEDHQCVYRMKKINVILRHSLECKSLGRRDLGGKKKTA
jgi:hypothetical protein